MIEADRAQSSDPKQDPTLTKFNLDFPGGTPAELVKAIEKATGKPLNAIIPDEDADIQLPALKMNDVVASQLFAALEAASRKTVMVNVGYNNYSQRQTAYGFKTPDNGTDNSIWYFYAEKPDLTPQPQPPLEKTCQFYSLEPYLNRGFTVDDITTAIQTGWKMSGDAPPPELNYHKETKLLIAFGTNAELETIIRVLQGLPASKVTIDQIHNMSDSITELQRQIKQLNGKVSALTPPQTTLELKSGQ